MILITGATGTVGSEVVKRLSAHAVQARALTRNLQRADAHRLPNVHFVQGDFEDVDSMRRACSGVDRAFLVTNSTERTEHQQTTFTQVAQQTGVRHIVKISQLHADPSAAERFLRYHGTVEAAIEASGLTFTFLRPNLYMQGLLNFRQSIQEKSAFFAAAGGARISAIDIRDMADVAVAALTTSQHDNKIYALTGPDALTFGDMARMLSKAVGRTITFVDVPAGNDASGAGRPGFPDLAGGRSARGVCHVPSWRGNRGRTRRARGLGPTSSCIRQVRA
jgi:uncharacterized protein YbjT (DUF2867 family)